MGIDLAKLVANRLGGLPGPSYKALTYMSLVALDQPNGKGQPARIYFAGREPLAVALGYDHFTPAAAQSVKRALMTLRERGLISDVGRAYYEHRASYRLNLTLADLAKRGTDGVPLPDLTGVPVAYPSPPEEGYVPRPPEGYATRTERGTPRVPRGVRHAYPLGHIEDSKDLPQDNTTHHPAQPHAAREDAGDDAMQNDLGPHAYRPNPWGSECLDCHQHELHRSHLAARRISTAEAG